MAVSDTEQDGVSQIEVEEFYCRGCGWTEPEFQEGDPALCSNCGVEYEPAWVLGVGGDGQGPASRTRTWPRCSGYNADGSRCERRTAEEYCHDHRKPQEDIRPDHLEEMISWECPDCGRSEHIFPEQEYKCPNCGHQRTRNNRERDTESE